MALTKSKQMTAPVVMIASETMLGSSVSATDMFAKCDCVSSPGQSDSLVCLQEGAREGMVTRMSAHVRQTPRRIWNTLLFCSSALTALVYTITSDLSTAASIMY